MVVNNKKFQQKMKNKSLLIMEKYYKMKKMTYYNYRKLFSFRKFTIILRSNDEEQIKAKYQDVF